MIGNISENRRVITKKGAVALIVIFCVTAILGLFVGKNIIGAHSNKYWYFVVFLLVDFLLLGTFIKTFKFFIRKQFWLIAIYFFPLFFIYLVAIISSITPIEDWNNFFRIYVPGLMMILVISKLVLLSFMLLGEIISFIVNFFRRIFNKKSQIFSKTYKIFTIMGAISAMLIVTLVIISCFKWTYDFKIHEVNYHDEGIPDSFNDFKIVHLSDIHFGSWYKAELFQKAVDKINSLKPDLVVFTGDLVNEKASEAYPFEDMMKQIKAEHGVYSVLGNHDYDYYNNGKTDTTLSQSELLADFYKRVNWKLLNNSNAILRKQNDSIALLGVENWSKVDRWGKYGDVELANKGTEKVPFKILLSHDPHHWQNVITENHKDINLTLSGHTHAMQMGFEKGKVRFSPAQFMFEQWAGLYSTNNDNNKQSLYVNRGLGTVAFPFRLGIASEITLITLKSN